MKCPGCNGTALQHMGSLGNAFTCKACLGVFSISAQAYEAFLDRGKKRFLMLRNAVVILILVILAIYVSEVTFFTIIGISTILYAYFKSKRDRFYDEGGNCNILSEEGKGDVARKKTLIPQPQSGSKGRDILHFKDSESALEYANQYMTTEDGFYIGHVLRSVDNFDQIKNGYKNFMISVAAGEKEPICVFAFQYPELKKTIDSDDLVVVALLDGKIFSIMAKLKPIFSFKESAWVIDRD